MTFQEKVKLIGDAHRTLAKPVYHFFRPKISGAYVIWQEDGASAHFTNNTAGEFGVSGTTDYFTKEEYDPVVDVIHAMFSGNGFAWSLNSIQHEEQTGYIHYEWSWER